MKNPVLLSSSLIVTACTFAAVLTARGQMVLRTPASLEEQLVPSYYLEGFEGFTVTGNQGTAPITLSGGTPTFEYSISAPGGLWVNSETVPYTRWLSTELPNNPITVTFTSGNVTAVGGNFFLTDNTQTAIAGSLTVELSDGRTEMVTSSAQVGTPPPERVFLGFTAFPDTFITSLTIGLGGLGKYTTLDNLYVGTAVPEPSQWGLCLGLASLGFAGIRRWRASR